PWSRHRPSFFLYLRCEVEELHISPTPICFGLPPKALRLTGISHMAAVTATARCSMSIIDAERAASSAVFVDLSLARGEATVEWGS
ncbi:MAG: hypothetical protein QGI88_01125, partial [SAR202 cluster bacterium]|nr:hypothetical protein [SAR202 cluster bacterium]